MNSIEGFILTGGASRRMGRDKAQLLLDGQSFVAHIAQALGAVTSSIKLVGRPENDFGLNLESVPDVHDEWGALGGVHAALSSCQMEWALVVACDLPFVTSELFGRLLGFREDLDAVAPVQSDGRPQPLCALYRVASCLPPAEKLIQSGERKPVALLQSVRTLWVPFVDLANLKGAVHFFDNINTPEDYALATQKGEVTKAG